MKTFQIIQSILIIIFLSFSHQIFAQTTSEPSQNKPVQMGQVNNMPMMQHMKEMDTMAKSMTKMADVCRMMMEKEMRNYPLKVVAFSFLAILGAIALILFVVLEIQWIRFWNVRTKTEQLKLK